MKVVLLDAYNLIYRSLSGFSKGENFVIFNFFRSLRPLIEMHDPDKVYFVLEGNPEFRKKLSTGAYKSNRKSKGENFHRQKASIINIIKACLPFDIVKHPQLECDDTIATISALHAKKGDQCVIISSDSDFMQLLNLGLDISIYNPIKKKYFEKPEYDYVTWKALRGDKTDNIMGIPGIGDKTATKIVNSEELLSEVLLDDSKREIFERNINLIRLVDFSDDMKQLESHSGKKNMQGLKKIFTDLEFTSMIKEKYWNNYVKTFERL